MLNEIEIVALGYDKEITEHPLLALAEVIICLTIIFAENYYIGNDDYVTLL